MYSYIVFEMATLPVLSIVHGFIDLGLYFKSRLHPIYALCGATVFMIAWLIQLGAWSSCEWFTQPLEHKCMQWYLVNVDPLEDVYTVRILSAKITFVFTIILL